MRGGYCGLDEKNIVALEKFNTLSNIHKYKYKKVTFKLREDEHKKNVFLVDHLGEPQKNCREIKTLPTTPPRA